MATDARQFMVRMPPEMHDALKEVAITEDRTMAQVVRQAIRQYTAGSGGKRRPKQ